MALREVKNIGFVQRWPRQHYNPHLNALVWHKGKRVEIEGIYGSNDDTFFYREKEHLYILSINEPLGYIGLAEYNLDIDPEDFSGLEEDYEAIVAFGELILDGDHNVEEVLGERGFSLRPPTMIRKMREYIW